MQVEFMNVTALPRLVVDHEVDACLDLECEVCGAKDCPMGEPLHYHHDGCPSCDLDQE